MTDPNAALHAREWLERQLAELGQLRNANRRDQNFKAWRQHTLTVIQRIWPGDSRRTDRFRRIPFSPPMSRATDRQVREFYERGWGEAGVLLREFLAEINLLGLRGALGAAPDMAAGVAPLPLLDALETADEPEPTEGVPPVSLAESEPPSAPGADDFGRAMERLLSSSPVFRGIPVGTGPASTPPAPEEGTVAAELIGLAEELEALGLTPAQASAARETLLSLAHVALPGAADWQLVQAALRHASITPALARRALPLLLELVERAA